MGFFEPLSENDLVRLWHLLNVANTQPIDHPMFKAESNYYLRAVNHVMAERHKQWGKLPAPDPKLPPGLPEPIIVLMQRCYERYIKRLCDRIETTYREPVDRLQRIRSLYYTLAHLGEINWLEQRLEAYIWQEMERNARRLFNEKSEWTP